MIPVIQKHVNNSEANYFRWYQLFRGLQDHEDGTMGFLRKIGYFQHFGGSGVNVAP